jgi:hypothetical protein
MLAHNGEIIPLAARTSWKFIAPAISTVLTLWIIASLTAMLTLWKRISALGWKESVNAFAGWPSAVLSHSGVAKLGIDFWGRTLQQHLFQSTAMLGACKVATFAGQFIVGIITAEAVITEDIHSLVEEYPDFWWRGHRRDVFEKVIKSIHILSKNGCIKLFTDIDGCFLHIISHCGWFQKSSLVEATES